MDEDQTVLVHAFHFYGRTLEDIEVATFKATHEAILALGGEPLAGTAERVPRSEVDESGHYRRMATGWGELAV
jgi:hypothetical protein